MFSFKKYAAQTSCNRSYVKMEQIAQKPIQFSEEQISAASLLSSQGLSDKAIAMASGVDLADLPELRANSDYMKSVQELAAKQVIAELEVDDEWSDVELMAVAHIKHAIQHDHERMSTMEKLRVAEMANKAKRRHGVFGESNKANTGKGILDNDEGRGGEKGITVNLNMPTIMLDRLRAIRESDGKVIEHEAKVEALFETTNEEEVTLVDVNNILGVDVEQASSGNTNVGAGAVAQDDGLANIFQHVVNEDPNVIAQTEG